MQLTEIRINLCGRPVPKDAPTPLRGVSRLRAFCSLTFDDTFVIRDVKLIEGDDGLFLAMPSRKLADHCPACHEKNHLRARYCNGCGRSLDPDRHRRSRGAATFARVKLHADIAHPINAATRKHIEHEVFAAYARELDRSQMPGYVAPDLDAEDFDFYDDHSRSDARAPFSPWRSHSASPH